MRVLIIDDHPLIAEGIAASMRGMAIAFEPTFAPDANAAELALDEPGQFDLILLDLGLPGVDGLSLLQTCRDRRPELPVVILSGHDEPSIVRQTLDMGAMGFISKRSPAKVVVCAVQLVLAGGVYIPPDYLASLPREAVSPLVADGVAEADLAGLGLTDRQMEVLLRVVAGKPTKVICRELGISEGTAKAHIAAILRALQVSNRTQVLYALSQLDVRLPGLLRRRQQAAQDGD